MKTAGRIKILIAAVAIILLGLAVLLRKPDKTSVVDSGYREVMGTFARVVIVCEDDETGQKAVEAAFKQLNKVESLMSTHRDNSEISRLNQMAADHPVTVSKETFEVLQKAIRFAKLSSGAFDITIEPALQLWQNAQNSNSPPQADKLNSVKTRIGYDKITLDSNNLAVSFKQKGVKIDLGGIAKGYAIDNAAKAAKASGALGGMIDAGGDISCFGRPPKKQKAWLIGLQNPSIKDKHTTYNSLVMTLKVNNTSVATSGNYRRFFTVEGKKHSHIINPETAAGVTGPDSVTVICNQAANADALATTLSVMGPTRGLELIEKLPETEAILIIKDTNEILTSSGAQDYIRNQ